MYIRDDYSYPDRVEFRRLDNGAPVSLITCTGCNSATNVHTIKITRNDNQFELFFDDVSKGAAYDNTYTTCQYQGIWINSQYSSDNHSVDNIKYHEYSCTAPTLDAKADGQDLITVCPGDNVELTANSSGGSGCGSPEEWRYAWYTGDGTGNTWYDGTDWDNPETASNVYSTSYTSINTTAETTTYKVKVKCTDNGCSATDATGVTVTVGGNGCTYYVSTTGSDETGNGTDENPYATIAYALSQAQSGEIISVAGGVYNITSQVEVNKAITIKSSTGYNDGGINSVVIDCGDGETNNNRAFNITENCTLRGLTIKDGRKYVGAGSAQNVGGGAIRFVASGKTLTVENCRIINCTAHNDDDDYNAWGGALYWYDGIVNITNTVFSGNDVKHGQVYSYEPGNPKDECLGGAVFIAATAAGGSIVNCAFYNNTSVSTDPSDTREEGGAVWMSATAGNVTVKNCIFWNNSANDYQNDLYHAGAGALVTYCDITEEDEAGNNWAKGEGCLQPGDNTPADDPLFSDAANGDFSLQPASTCINAGTDVGAPDTDITGTPRPQGAAIDMGGYEKIITSLIVEAGEDKTITFGDKIAIGGAPTASGGIPPYQYTWYPPQDLEINNSKANPLAQPVTTKMFHVVVTDAAGQSASDSVQVSVNINPSATGKLYSMGREITDPETGQVTKRPMYVYTRTGDSLLLQDIQITHLSEIAGMFMLHFNDPVDNGFNDDANDGVQLRALMKQVFEDISVFLGGTLPIDPYTGNAQFVQIDVTSQNDPSSPALGEATPYYLACNICYGHALTYGTIWEFINTGLDPYYFLSDCFDCFYTVPQVGPGLYHGAIRINFGHNLHIFQTSFPSTGSGNYDLYTVVLHEIMHCLGVASRISDYNGTISNIGPHYSIWDNYLYVGSSKILSYNIDDFSNCYQGIIVNPLLSISDISGVCGNVDPRFITPGNQLNAELYTGTLPYTINYFSHFNCTPQTGYVMNTSPVTVEYHQRYPNTYEAQALCAIGYSVTDNYGNGGALLNGTSEYIHNYTGQSCVYSRQIAGANDFFVNGTNAPNFSVDYDGSISFTIYGSINNIMQNDFNAVKICCPMSIQGSLTNITDDGFTFSPYEYYAGETAVISYFPVNAADQRGNRAYIFVDVGTPDYTCEGLVNCGDNLICFGDFENIINRFARPFSDFHFNNYPGNTPDLLIYDGVDVHVNTPYGPSHWYWICPVIAQITNPIPYSTGNNRYIHIHNQQSWQEGIYLPLKVPLMQNDYYTLSYTAYNIDPACNPAYDIYFSDIEPCESASDWLACSGITSSYVGAITVTQTGWNTYSYSFQAPAGNLNYIIIQGSGNENSFAFFDDFIITSDNAAPTADAGTDISICDGSSTQLNASGGESYSWSPATGLSCTDCQNPVANPAFTTVYTVTVTDIYGCTDDDDITVTVLPNPSVSFTHTDASCLDNDGQATAIPSGGTAPYSMQWNIYGSSVYTQTATGLGSGTFYVTVTDDNGCIGTGNVTISAATDYWPSHPSGQTEKNTGTDLVSDALGNVYVLTEITSPSITIGSNTYTVDLSDVFVIKYDNCGNVLWVQQISSSENMYAGGIALDNSGLIVITGHFKGTCTIGGITIDCTSDFTGASDVYVMKFLPTGAVVFAVDYGYADLHYEGKDITFDNSNNIYVVGHRFSNPSTADYSDILLLKFSQSGLFLDAYTDGTTGKDFGNGIAFLNNNIYITGFQDAVYDPSNPFYGGGDNNDSGWFYIRKYDLDLIPYPPAVYSQGEGNEIVAFNGDLYAAGYVVSGIDESNILVYRIDPGNLPIPVSSYNGFTNSPYTPAYADEATDLAFDNAGNLFITGSFQGTGNLNEGYINSGIRDIFVNRIDPTLNPMLSNWPSGALTSSSVNDERSYAIAFDNAGGNLYITGTFNVQTILSNDIINSATSDPNFWDMYVARLHDQGSGGEFKILQVQQEEAEQVPDESDIQKADDTGYINIYPNPAKTEINIDFQFPGQTNSLIEMYDITGRKVLTGRIPLQQNGVYMLDIENTVKGIYYIRIKNQFVNSNNKIVVQ
ncbi:MAG: T9SS type A sorting domain-containing protein [Bacteroidetes bacterium]|nr:T9SS type A sorting domain-containing protein [Bacteroidota bacterium]